MTIEISIYEALKALVPAGDGTFKVFPDVAKEGTAAPWITYQQVGGSATNYLESAIPDRRNARIQITVWATTRPEASALARQAEALLVNEATIRAYVLGAFTSAYEPDGKLYGTRQDFSISYT